MDYMTFFKCIKAGTLGGAYILHGEEEFVKDSALKSVVSSLDEAARELNSQYMETADADELISACETLPFFAEKRLVVCKSLPTEESGKRICGYLPNIPSSTLLIFFIRGRAKGTLSIVKAIAGKDKLVEFPRFSRQEALRWVMQQPKRLGVTMTERAGQHIVNLAGTDIAVLNNELNKAAGYVGLGNEITMEAVSACVTRSLEYKIFDMMDYLMAGKAQDGLRVYRHMIADGESAFGIAAFMENRFKEMLIARSHIDKGLNRDTAVKLMGGKYTAKKAYEAALKYDRECILSCLCRFADVGYLQVSGQQQADTALESAILRCLPRRRT